MIEAGVVIDINGAPIYWHLPDGRTGGSLPDSQPLWEVLWEHRDILGGFAHSHPGSGTPDPSRTDITTFIAVEAGLGRHLDWWITSSDRLIVCRRYLPQYRRQGVYSYISERGIKYNYLATELSENPPWAQELRRLSSD